MGGLCCRPVRCGAGLLAAAEKTQEFYHARRPEFYRGSAVCAGHHLGQQWPRQSGDAAGDLRRYFIWAAVSTHLCTLLDWSASAYCSIWIVLTTESTYELWRVLIWTAQALGMRHLPLHSTPMLLGQLGFAIACCVTVRYTMARTMPEDGIYHIGPRQLGSAGLLGAISSSVFALQTVCASGCSHRR